jgi:abortive infection bacteriophage resistance protein
MPQIFAKPSLNIQQQIDLLQGRGMIFEDMVSARRALTYISYYRLRAYWHYFEEDVGIDVHRFKDATTFGKVLDLYNYDRQLRLLIIDAIERIEVAARGSWAHHIALIYGSHGYIDPNLYGDELQFAKNLTQLSEEVERSHDAFIAHYKTKYGEPKLPPVWMVAEVMSFGLLSKFVSSISVRSSRQAIARPFGLDEKVFRSFMHHLGTVRNICAHHGRLWNRRLTITMIQPALPSALAASINKGAERQIYNTLVIMAHCMHAIAPTSSWVADVANFLKSHPNGDVTSMGAPKDWASLPIWI